MAQRLDARDTDFDAQFQGLLSVKRENEPDVQSTVSEILADVKARDDAAVIDHTRRLDKFDLTAETMRFTSQEIVSAVENCNAEEVEALKLAAARIMAFHEKQIPEDLRYTDDVGVELGYRWTALEAVGLYVPGGTASYPSSVLMNAVPAKVAGVRRVVMVVPTPGGVINPLVLAAAHIAGIDEVYKIGGAQAVGALAYGTETITPVDKIVGPGNAYVAAAKRQVFGTVGIDMIAGPSEILVVADGENDPAWIAADLLSQAEHDTAAQSVLITDDASFADAVEQAVEAHLTTLPRAKIARESWDTFGAVVVVNNLTDACPLVDRIAPEHLELAVADPEGMLSNIRNAGAVFLGRHTPEALGDYMAGPNHVLPTAGSARFSSGLGVLDFLKRSTLIGASPESLATLGPSVETLAKAEGLDAHGLSVSIRLNRRTGG
ncbi:MAG: histidinol dehydrogenase [Rhodospirillaceae bacterium]|jgi:histidinol dehydrogenase|nr:histidinol dehydrogenase [Rhodospirillaceae bacterium]MBT7485710.1 histidinol dehydrogenase [Rhodospirillales bacterium]MBT4703538.1 histidinol dehydrogenase [Rhodospirillaceae bacterium]MBT5033574.1 histidinol dehydrogenase [Rhodospirillaceae bacterium]MBT6218383.1 histidinol dehydrogenase [Rhodospirillaceae bacterium]